MLVNNIFKNVITDLYFAERVPEYIKTGSKVQFWPQSSCFLCSVWRILLHFIVWAFISCVSLFLVNVFWISAQVLGAIEFIC